MAKYSPAIAAQLKREIKTLGIERAEAIAQTEAAKKETVIAREELENVNAVRESQKDGIEKDLANYNLKKITLAEEIAVLESNKQQKTSEMRKFTELLGALRDELKKALGNFPEATQFVDELVGRSKQMLATLQGQIADKESELNILSTQKNEKEGELETLQGRKEELLNELENFDEKVLSDRKDYEKLLARREIARAEIISIQEREEEIESMRAKLDPEYIKVYQSLPSRRNKKKDNGIPNN